MPAAGEGVRVIAMSLWGAEDLYCLGAVANARLVRSIYPGWTLRVYCDPAVPVVDELRALDADVRLLPDPGGFGAAYWRFLPAVESEIEYFVVRDADSRLNVREKAAVDAWLASGRPAHVMRDHPGHRHWPMLGGMWGARGGLLPDVRRRMARFRRWRRKGDDQWFLAFEVWPAIREQCLVHSSVPDPLGGAPFPAHPPYEGFVGEPVPVRSTTSLVVSEAPPRGRPA
jgi:hypothetical protein